MVEKLFTVKEVASILGISENDVIKLSEEGKIPAYRIGGVYLRFKKDQVEKIRGQIKHLKIKTKPKNYSLTERVCDFFYFNDFYILSAILILIMLWIIFRT